MIGALDMLNPSPENQGIKTLLNLSGACCENLLNPSPENQGIKTPWSGLFVAYVMLNPSPENQGIKTSERLCLS